MPSMLIKAITLEGVLSNTRTEKTGDNKREVLKLKLVF